MIFIGEVIKMKKIKKILKHKLPPRHRAKKHLKGTIVVLIMAMIFYLSAQVASNSTEMTEGVIDIFLNIFGIEQRELFRDVIFMPLRKSAHFLIYFLLGAASFSFVKDECKTGYKNSVIISLIFCALFAISDEIHQYYVPGRSCEVRDMLIDTTGALSGILTYYFLRTRRKDAKKY